MHRPKILDSVVKNINSASTVSLDINIQKLLKYFGKNEAGLDFF